MYRDALLIALIMTKKTYWQNIFYNIV